MTYVVTEQCIRCKYTDCVTVCPVDCFREGAEMLVIDPEICIDCAVCEPACPVEAVKPDTHPDGVRWKELNAAGRRVAFRNGQIRADAAGGTVRQAARQVREISEVPDRLRSRNEHVKHQRMQDTECPSLDRAAVFLHGDARSGLPVRQRTVCNDWTAHR